MLDYDPARLVTVVDLDARDARQPRALEDREEVPWHRLQRVYREAIRFGEWWREPRHRLRSDVKSVTLASLHTSLVHTSLIIRVLYVW